MILFLLSIYEIDYNFSVVLCPTFNYLLITVITSFILQLHVIEYSINTEK